VGSLSEYNYKTIGIAGCEALNAILRLFNELYPIILLLDAFVVVIVVIVVTFPCTLYCQQYIAKNSCKISSN